MQAHDVMTELGDLPALVVTRDTTEAEATAAVRALGTLGSCLLGVTRFSCLTPWELHPDAGALEPHQRCSASRAAAAASASSP